MYCVDARMFSLYGNTPLGEFLKSWIYKDSTTESTSLNASSSSSLAVSTDGTKRRAVRATIAGSDEIISEKVGGGGSHAEIPLFAHLTIEPIDVLKAKGITHTSLAGGKWKIACNAGNELFLREYARAVTADWMHRFHPVRSVKLLSELAAYQESQQLLLNPDLRDFCDDSRDSVSTIPTSHNDMFGSNTNSRDQSEFEIHLDHGDSLPAWPSGSSPLFYDSPPSLLDRHESMSLDGRLNHSSSSVLPTKKKATSSARALYRYRPCFASIGEIASPQCFRLFFDLDTFWACDQLCDDDLALISIIFQVIQASVRLFYPNMSDEEWQSFGTIVGKRTELRPEISSRTEYSVAWNEGLARITANEKVEPTMYAHTKKSLKSASSSIVEGAVGDDSGTANVRRAPKNRNTSLARDETSSVASSSSRLTHASLWRSETSSSSISTSSSNSASSNHTSGTFQAMMKSLLFDDNEDRTLHGDNASVSQREPNGAHQLLAQFSAQPNRGHQSTPKSKRHAKPKPKCAGKLSDFFADSIATVAAAEAQISKNRVFMPYKLGMNAHFPRIRVTADQARLIREYVVVQLVTNVICRSDLLQNCRILAFGKSLVKLTDHRLSSTLAFWNTVVDQKVYGTGPQGGPHCRMIFSRKISDCRQCADYERKAAAGATSSTTTTNNASKKRFNDGSSKLRAVPSSTSCPTCGGYGKADEGPDAVSHGMFAIKGNGLVYSLKIESCIDVSKCPRRTATFAALQSRPIKIGNFASSQSANGGRATTTNSSSNLSTSIATVWTPCVRWMPYDATNVDKLTLEWVNLTSIRYIPNIMLANGEAPSESLTQGFVVPPCWCHLFDETLTAGKSWCNDQLNHHMKEGYNTDSIEVAEPSSVAKMHQIVQNTMYARRGASINADTHQHTVAHDSLAGVLNFEKYSRSRAIESISGIPTRPLKTPSAKGRLGLKYYYIATQLHNLVRDAQPHFWDRLNFDVPILEMNPWRLDKTLPKSKIGPHLYEHYQGAERAAIEYSGMCWTMTCSGASVHNCLIKGARHTSACIHFRVTPTHVFQLCYSRKSPCLCFKKFVIVCQVPPSLSRLLFDTI